MMIAGRKILGEGADQRRAPRGRHVAGRQGTLHLGEVRGPVAEAEHEAQPEHDPDPIGRQRIGDVVDAQPPPGVQPRFAERLEVLDLVHQAVDATDGVQRHQRQREQRGDDHEELQHLVVDRRGQSAERDVDEHERRRDDNGERHRPAEHEVDDQRQREQVDAGDEHRRHGERPGIEGVRGLVEAQPQVLGHRTDLGAVVERHHHDPQEHHRGDRADPVIVHGGDPVLRSVGGLAEDLQRAEIGGDEGQAGDPRRQRAARQEEVQIGLDRHPRDESDPQDHGEVDRQDDVVDRAGVQPQHVPLSSLPADAGASAESGRPAMRLRARSRQARRWRLLPGHPSS
jgi:hypothetical protein